MTAWVRRFATLACLAAALATHAAPIDLSPVVQTATPVTLPAHWQHGAFMEIFVRAYQDSDGDGIGDLRGLTGRLDYLKSLGIKGLWLMPIQKNADGDHGYATVDYRAASHPLFEAARSDPASPWRDGYVWSDTAPEGWDIWGKNPWYWVGGGNPPWMFKGEMKDLPESRALTKRLQDLIKSYPNRFVVCEATAEPQAYGDPAVCGGAFAFGYVQHFVGAAQGKTESVVKLAEYYRSASPTMATFLSNHDIFAGRRLWDQVDGDVARYKLAAAGYLLQPGTPFIYYGEEVGQAGAAGLDKDQPLRAPMSWTADVRGGGFTRGTPFRPIAPNVATNNVQAQARDPDSILNFYKAMLALRNTRPSIARGSFEHSFADGLVLGFERALGHERTLVLINYGTATAEAKVADLPPHARLRAAYPRWGAGAMADAGGGATLMLAPQSVRVLDVRR